MRILDERYTQQDNENDSLTKQLLECELQRICYLVKSYHRTRLAKLQLHRMFYASDGVPPNTLSEAEACFVRQLNSLTNESLSQMFLCAFPDDIYLRSLESSDECPYPMSSIPVGPNTTTQGLYTAIETRGLGGVLPLPDDDGGGRIELSNDHRYILRHNKAKELVLSGRAIFI